MIKITKNSLERVFKFVMIEFWFGLKTNFKFLTKILIFIEVLTKFSMFDQNVVTKISVIDQIFGFKRKLGFLT